jgi:hypothetical protein
MFGDFAGMTFGGLLKRGGEPAALAAHVGEAAFDIAQAALQRGERAFGFGQTACAARGVRHGLFE